MTDCQRLEIMTQFARHLMASTDIVDLRGNLFERNVCTLSFTFMTYRMVSLYNRCHICSEICLHDI